MTVEDFIEWADSTPAVTWGGSDGVKDRWRKGEFDGTKH